VHEIVSEFVEQLVRQHFGKYATGGLQQHVTYVGTHTQDSVVVTTFYPRVILVDHIRKRAEASREKINWLLGLEDLPFTASAFSSSCLHSQR
jgi:hypothetical protein